MSHCVFLSIIYSSSNKRWLCLHKTNVRQNVPGKVQSKWWWWAGALSPRHRTGKPWKRWSKRWRGLTDRHIYRSRSCPRTLWSPRGLLSVFSSHPVTKGCHTEIRPRIPRLKTRRRPLLAYWPFPVMIIKAKSRYIIIRIYVSLKYFIIRRCLRTPLDGISHNCAINTCSSKLFLYIKKKKSLGNQENNKKWARKLLS